MTTENTPSVNIIQPREGQRIAFAGSVYTILLGEEASQNNLSIIEMNIPPDSGPVPHQHKGFQECFYMLEGTVTFRSEGGGSVQASRGALVHIPLQGPVHQFVNESGAPAKLLCIVSPAGLDAMFLKAGKPLAKEENPPPPTPPGPEEQERLKQLAAEYGQKVFPPDYLKKNE